MLEIVLDEADRQHIKDVLKRLDPSQANSAVKMGVMSASVYVKKVLDFNIRGEVLNRRTGNLARSMGMRLEQDGRDWVGTIGSGARVSGAPVVQPEIGEDIDDDGIRMSYADILEEGGTITPKTKQFLAIPIGDAVTPSGVDRFSAQQLKDDPEGFGYAGSVIINGIIFGLKDKKTRSEMTPLFVLKRSVEIPAKHYMEITIAESESQSMQEMVDAIDGALNK